LLVPVRLVSSIVPQPSAVNSTICVRVPVDPDHEFRLIVIIQSVRS
jgi:hypothetical protein